MDIFQPELTQTDDELTLAPQQSAASMLADCWVTQWSAANATAERHQESERATHLLCAALPLRTVEEARLN